MGTKDNRSVIKELIKRTMDLQERETEPETAQVVRFDILTLSDKQ